MLDESRSEEFANQQKTGKNYINLGIYTILHAVYFPGCVREGRKKLLQTKYDFIKKSKLFEIVVDLICEEIKYFDLQTFRQKCVQVLINNYESSKENSSFRRKINVINATNSLEGLKKVFHDKQNPPI